MTCRHHGGKWWRGSPEEPDQSTPGDLSAVEVSSAGVPRGAGNVQRVRCGGQPNAGGRARHLPWQRPHQKDQQIKRRSGGPELHYKEQDSPPGATSSDCEPVLSIFSSTHVVLALNYDLFFNTQVVDEGAIVEAQSIWKKGGCVLYHTSWCVIFCYRKSSE